MLSLPPRRFARQAVRSAAFTAVVGPHVLAISVSGTLLGRSSRLLTVHSDVLGIWSVLKASQLPDALGREAAATGVGPAAPPPLARPRAS